MHSLAAAAAVAAYRNKENAEDGKLQTQETDDTSLKKAAPKTQQWDLKQEVKCLETS